MPDDPTPPPDAPSPPTRPPTATMTPAPPTPDPRLELIEAAERAATTGNRTAVLTYLRLKRLSA